MLNVRCHYCNTKVGNVTFRVVQSLFVLTNISSLASATSWNLAEVMSHVMQLHAMAMPPRPPLHCSATFNDHRHLSHIVAPSFRPSSHIAAGINVVMLDVGGALLLPLTAEMERRGGWKETERSNGRENRWRRIWFILNMTFTLLINKLSFF